MARPLTYQKFDDDVFMLLCRAETPVSKMPEHPVIQELEEQLDETREADGRVTGYPYGPITKISAWRGFFTIGKTRFRIMSIYPFYKFFGLVCDTVDGTHDTGEIMEFVNGVNEAVAASLGVESIG